MTDLTLRINEKSKAGKALRDLIEVLSKSNEKVVEILDENQNFVEKVLNSYKKDKRTRIATNDLWESI